MNPLITDFRVHAPATPVIVALDFDNASTTLNFVRQLRPELCQLKIGKELFTASGRSLAESLINQGFKLFLDLKFHDIPNTVAAACKAAAQMGVWMVDMHASGGKRMMEAAADAVAHFSSPPLLIGVTVLTSMAQQDLAEVGVSCSIEEQVLRLASLAQQSGLNGVVSSAQEAELLKSRLGDDFVLVTPGIRLNTDNTQDDQRRIMTPKAALASGSHYLVIGRPITQAAAPAAVLSDINLGLL
ncbi:orotidine-5'-phosphate decarboxylase [Stenoxybacter acetivorans]|uniref:orotidine-5'-phosphate decarboxylase n=1 Tax=Stenoxybacter acetivorans TaxID=422441 RepID=UPI00055AAC60|nr:orotidine-5'-phosphate decarboxylase [Stenoxybacter acetivorans]